MSVEVERKWGANEEDENVLRKVAKYHGEKTFEDVYYDDETYFLTTHDIWLRRREKNYEMKVPIHNNPLENNSSTQVTKPQSTTSSLPPLDEYTELETEPEVVSYLVRLLHKYGRSKPQDNDTSLSVPRLCEAHSIRPFASIVTTRRSFSVDHTNDSYHIVLDVTQFGYRVGEVELMVKTPEESEAASLKIEALMRQHGFIRGEQTRGVRSKLVEFIRLNDKKHYQALLDCGWFDMKRMQFQ